MNKTAAAQSIKTTQLIPGSQGVLQRKCACGSHTIAGSECEECSKKKSGLQRKLVIGASNDPLEREADLIADNVLSGRNKAHANRSIFRMQRYSNRLLEASETVPDSVVRVLGSSGKPLDKPLRTEMESGFGLDFSGVRVHNDPAAEKSAMDVNAQAYTIGNHVVFGSGQYSPGTREGRRLIAHELAHVVQQSCVDGNNVGQSNDKRDLSSVDLVLLQRAPGINGKDSFHDKAAPDIDKTIAASFITKYIPKKNLKTLAGNVDVLTPSDYEDAYKAWGESKIDVKDVPGFTDRSAKKPIKLRTMGKDNEGRNNYPSTVEAAIHETVHLNSHAKFRGNFPHNYNEGVTQHFTNNILGQVGAAYRDELKLADKLIADLGSNGEDIVAKAYFNGAEEPFATILKGFRQDPNQGHKHEWEVAAQKAPPDWKNANRLLLDALKFANNPSSKTPPATSAPASTTNSPKVQKKLTINQPTDRYEQEADLVADQVLSMPSHSAANYAPLCIQRFKGQASESIDAVPPSVDHVLTSSGKPLEPGLRQDMEQRFGYDFSQVRLHLSQAAEQSARDVNAHAYTVGQNIVFAANRFAPNSLDGRKLIAHELTHTVQQSRSPLSSTDKTAFWNESSRTRKEQYNPFASQKTAPSIQFQNDREALNIRLKQVQDRLAKLRMQYTQLSDDFTDSLSKERQNESLQKGTENLQKQARSESSANTLWGGRFARDRILKSARVAQGGTTATVSADFELSYLALSDEKGREQATIDIPRIEAAIRDVWQVDIASGDYAGISFRFQPKVNYLPKTSKHSESSFHIQVRGADKEPSSGDSVSGIISLAPAHLEGARVIVIAHELAHLFGFTDTYITMVTRDKSGKEREQWGVGRVNPANRADLLGMIDPDKLARLEKQGAVLPSEVKRQTGTVRIWEEEANIVLRVLGATPLPPERPSPDSENFDPADELEKQKREGEGKLAKIREKKGRIDNTMKSLEIAEEIMQLEKEEASLKARLSSNP